MLDYDEDFCSSSELKPDWTYMDQRDIVNPGSEYSTYQDVRERIVNFSVLKFLSEPVLDPGFVAGLFPRGDVSLLVGDTGSGKSMFAMQLALSVAANRSFLGQPIDNRPELGKVVGLFREDTRSKVHMRLSSIYSDLTIAPEITDPRLHIQWLASEQRDGRDYSALWRAGKATKGFALMNEVIKDLQTVDLLIIDTLKIAFDDDMIDPLSARRFVAALRDVAIARNIAIVCISHTNSQGKAAGTSEWSNHVRAVFRIKIYLDHYLFECLKTNYARAMAPQKLVRTKSGVFVLMPVPEVSSRCSAIHRSPDRRLREFVLNAIQASSEASGRQRGGYSRHKKAKNYAPKAIVGLLKAQRIKASQADLEAVMEVLIGEGLLVETRKPGKHPTMILAVSAVAQEGHGPDPTSSGISDIGPDVGPASH